jgi:hypothetical protein
MFIKVGTPLKDFLAPIMYHENKVEDGEAESIFNTLNDESPYKKAMFLNQIAGQNDKVINKGFDIAVSFHPDERLSNDEMKAIGVAVMDRLAFHNTPFIFYRHDDKPHGHFHIVTTSVDLSGKKIKEFQINARAKQAAIELEKEFFLRQTIRAEKTSFDRDYQVFNYSVARAAVKYSGLYIADIPVDDLYNKSIVELNSIYGREKVDLIYREFSRMGLINKSERVQLMEALRDLRKDYKSDYSLNEALQRKGYYSRILSNGEMIIKLPGGDYYYKLHEIEKFHKPLNSNSSNNTIDQDKAKDYTKRIVTRYFKSSSTLEDFIEKCGNANIQVSFNTYKDGTAYGLTFTNIGSGHSFKGSQIGLSFNELINKYDQTKGVRKEPFKPSKARQARRIAKKLGYLLEQTDDDNNKKKQL